VHSEALDEALEPFLNDGLVEEILFPIKSGKEAVVYCCRGGDRLDQQLVAAKVYKSRAHRAFRNDALYREGRVILNKRDARAAAKRTRHGRDVMSGTWTNHEWDTLRTLYAAGADVPMPLAHSGTGLLMEYIGNAEQAAPALRGAELSRHEATSIWERLLDNIQLWLSCYIVHGDLSAYNVLYDGTRAVVIDFPQAIDPRFNGNAYSLLLRDVENLARFFARYGVESDPSALVDQLWRSYERP
jgi:RIO kinase 1